MNPFCAYCDKPVFPEDQAPYDDDICREGDALHKACVAPLREWAEEGWFRVTTRAVYRNGGYYITD